MSAIPYMPLYVADYLADAAHLTTEEHGAYLLLIMTYWQRGKPLPADPQRLANIARMSNERWTDVQRTLEQFFVVENETWVHKRIETELGKFRARSDKAKAAGRASGASRKNKEPTSVQRKSNVSSADVERTLNHTDTDTDTEDSEVKSQPATKVETEAACVRADLSEAEQALDEMISSIRSWGNSMNIVEARTWLSTTVRTYGQRPTARAYHQLKTELQTGQLIGHPLRAWGSIAERFRAEDAERKAAKDAPPKLSKTREAINRRLAKQAALAAEMEAKPHG